MHPLATHLPFNRESLAGLFVPAKTTDSPPIQRGHWLLVQDNALLVLADDGGSNWQLPQGPLPDEFDGTVTSVVCLGTYRGAPCWAASLSPETAVPSGFQKENLLPARTRLTDDLLSLGGLALQALHWEATSLHCPRCGAKTASMPGEVGKRCPQCSYEHYPHLHPCVIVLVRDRNRVLLTRKSFWPTGRYGLVAGFVEAGESLEAAAAREVQEEVGVQIRSLQYIASQYWPFPSQLMAGFTAEYAIGDIVVNQHELEDARWFPIHALPDLPPKLSIARFLIDRFAHP